MPRNRTARPAVLGASVRRPAPEQTSTKSKAHLKRRLVVGGLVLLALLLVTISYGREAGPVGSAQDAAASALRPLEVGAERVARPFRDLWGWFEGLRGAKENAERLRAENETLRQKAVQSEFARRENARLKALLDFREGPQFPDDYAGLAAALISRPAGAFSQAIVVSVGAQDGVEVNAPVVTGGGLVGLVTRVATRSSRVTLLNDEQSAVSALVVRSGASGVVRHGRNASSALVLDRVPKAEDVRVGDVVVTSGWRSGQLESLYPKGIQIGRVVSVGQTDTDLYKQIQVEPFADLAGVDSVLVLQRKDESP